MYQNVILIEDKFETVLFCEIMERQYMTLGPKLQAISMILIGTSISKVDVRSKSNGVIYRMCKLNRPVQPNNLDEHF